MTIETSSDIRPTHVQLHCRGTFDIESALEVYSTAFDLAVAEDLDAILIDATELHGPPPTAMERYRQGEYVAELSLKAKEPIRIAVVGKVPMVHPHRIGETVGRANNSLERIGESAPEARGDAEVGCCRRM